MLFLTALPEPLSDRMCPETLLMDKIRLRQLQNDFASMTALFGRRLVGDNIPLGDDLAAYLGQYARAFKRNRLVRVLEDLIIFGTMPLSIRRDLAPLMDTFADRVNLLVDITWSIHSPAYTVVINNEAEKIRWEHLNMPNAA